MLTVSRASLYYQPAAPSAEELALKRAIDELYTAHPFYGSRRICQQLRRGGLVISRKSVQRQMQEVGLIAIGPKPNTSRASPGHAVYPYLLRDLRSGWPNHIWGIDITYIRLASGWLYLVAVLDWGISRLATARLAKFISIRPYKNKRKKKASHLKEA